MLDTYGIIMVLRLITGASFDAAVSLPYYIFGPLYRPVMSLSNLHSTVKRAFACEEYMPTGHYERKPRESTARITFTCEQCGSSFTVLASVARSRKTVKYCSRTCAGVAYRKEGVFTDAHCALCGVSFQKRADHLKEANFCSVACYAKYRERSNSWRTPERRREYMRAYNTKNRAKHNERARKWNKDNHHKKAAIRQARRAKAKASNFTADLWQQMKAKYDYTCLCCKQSEPHITLTLDHIVPLARGGEHTEANIQPLCNVCNSRKGTKTIDFRIIEVGK